MQSLPSSGGFVFYSGGAYSDNINSPYQMSLTKWRLLPIGRYFDMFAPEYYA